MNYSLSSLILLLLLICLLKTSYGNQNLQKNCTPSACGNIRNISFPFRLKDDPEHCGCGAYQLSCENETTSIYFHSHKFNVRAINYDNYTIHLSYASLINNDICSLPTYSLSEHDLGIFVHYFSIQTQARNMHDYSATSPDRSIAWPITIMSCPYMVKNSSSFVKTDSCVKITGGRRHKYIKLGYLNASDVWDMCKIDATLLSSSILLKHNNFSNASLVEVHGSLLYGFELSWYGALCGESCFGTCLDDEEGRPKCANNVLHNVCANKPRMISCGHYLIFRFIGRCVLAGAEFGAMINLAIRIFIGIPCILVILICKYRRRHSSMFVTIEDYLQSTNKLMPIRYSYSEIKKMSRGFQEKLGEGGYGSVFKAKLRSGHDVAIKVLSKPKGNGQDFINEVATIGRIHHVNVVRLIGFCAERSKCALVFDFMSKGSLEKYIFSKEESNSLSWDRKYDIALGVARGIEYLHRGCDIQILHFDIKPHNILLDNDFNPRISDFGLAKFYSTDKNTVTFTTARGTVGYVAPELINRSIGNVSYKADVYSFGMLLIEMVGLNLKRDIVAGNDGKSSQYFPDWIYDRLNKGQDIKLENDDDIDDSADVYVKKISRLIIVVGLWCIRMSPDDRPSMSDVVKMLEGQDENMQIPPMPSESYQVAHKVDHDSWEIESSDSITLLGEDTSSYQLRVLS